MFSVTARMHIDEMRSLLELWYDETHLKRWRAKRQGEFKVFNSVAQGLRFYMHPRIYSLLFPPSPMILTKNMARSSPAAALHAAVPPE